MIDKVKEIDDVIECITTHKAENGEIHERYNFVFKDTLTRFTYCDKCRKAVTWTYDRDINIGGIK